MSCEQKSAFIFSAIIHAIRPGRQRQAEVRTLLSGPAQTSPSCAVRGTTRECRFRPCPRTFLRSKPCGSGRASTASRTTSISDPRILYPDPGTHETTEASNVSIPERMRTSCFSPGSRPPRNSREALSHRQRRFATTWKLSIRRSIRHPDRLSIPGECRLHPGASACISGEEAARSLCQFLKMLQHVLGGWVVSAVRKRVVHEGAGSGVLERQVEFQFPPFVGKFRDFDQTLPGSQSFVQSPDAGNCLHVSRLVLLVGEYHHLEFEFRHVISLFLALPVKIE